MTKICRRCDKPYELDPEEVRTREYSPLCTECLRAGCETPPELKPPHVPEEIMGDRN
jgi:hypothetical protein